jgi:hypothetical protein
MGWFLARGCMTLARPRGENGRLAHAIERGAMWPGAVTTRYLCVVARLSPARRWRNAAAPVGMPREWKGGSDVEMAKAGGAMVSQWRWGTLAIVGDLGRLRRDPGNKREVSSSSIEGILWSVGHTPNREGSGSRLVKSSAEWRTPMAGADETSSGWSWATPGSFGAEENMRRSDNSEWGLDSFSCHAKLGHGRKMGGVWLGGTSRRGGVRRCEL